MARASFHNVPAMGHVVRIRVQIGASVIAVLSV